MNEGLARSSHKGARLSPRPRENCGPVLGIDTSGTTGSVALLTGDTEREIVFSEGLIHGVALAPTVERILSDAGIVPADLGAVAVGTGPGSYTGTRVGVAFAKSLAFAAELPIAGVSSFDAMAENAPYDQTVACVGDARRETFYVAVFGPGREPLVPLCLVGHDAARRLLPADALVIGDAAELFEDLLSGEGRVIGNAELGRSSAVAVARLGREQLRNGAGCDLHDLSPIYLRPSEAEERADRLEGSAE